MSTEKEYPEEKTRDYMSKCRFCGEEFQFYDIGRIKKYKSDGKPLYQYSTPVYPCRLSSHHCSDDCFEKDKLRIVEENLKIEAEYKKDLEDSYFAKINGEILANGIISVQQHKNGFKITLQDESVLSVPPGIYKYKVAKKRPMRATTLMPASSWSQWK